MNVVKETIEIRESKGIERKDFMQLLIQLKNKGVVEDIDMLPKDAQNLGLFFSSVRSWFYKA